MKYPRIMQAFFSTPWAIQPEKLDAIIEFLELKALGEQINYGKRSIEGIEAVTGGRLAKAGNSGNLGVIPVQGVIAHRIHMVDDISGDGGTSTELLGLSIDKALADESIKTIVLDVDSPGGSVAGVQEVADKIFKARETKPVIAVANSLAASAAYWIASAATELVITPSGMAGSIGVIATHTDFSQFEELNGFKTTLISAGKFKIEGNELEPLSDEARGTIQGVVNEYYNSFVAAVARNRGVKTDAVRNGFGQGRSLTAKNALAENMVDRIDTLENTIARVSRRSPSRKMHAEIDRLEIG